LKEALSITSILKIYNTEAETGLHIDASAQGYAAIFLERDNETFFTPGILCEWKNNGGRTEIS